MAALRSSQRAVSCLTRARITTTTTSISSSQQRLYSTPNDPLSPSPPSPPSPSPSPAPPAAPPLLQKLKADLKAAMRSKDAPRLSVIRSVLAAALNASKTARPVATDAQLVSLVLRRQRAASEEAAAEFRAAGRDDLLARERDQIRVLDEYIAGSGVEALGGERLRAVVVAAAAGGEGSGGNAKGAKAVGDVMKKLLAPGGPLEGKSFEKAELAGIVKEVIG